MKATPGTVSWGTDAVEVLASRFAYALENLGGADKHRNLIASARTLKTHAELSPIVDRLMAALDEYAPEGHAFASRIDDDSDYGFWPISEADV